MEMIHYMCEKIAEAEARRNIFLVCQAFLKIHYDDIGYNKVIIYNIKKGHI